MLRVCLNHKIITLVSALGIFALTLIPVFQGWIGTDFMGEQDSGRMSVTVELQRGTRVEETMRMARLIEDRFVQVVPEIELISSTTDSDDEAGISSIFNSTNNNILSITVRTNKKYQRERSIFDIAEDLRSELATFPEQLNYQVSTSSCMGGGNGNTVDVEIL